MSKVTAARTEASPDEESRAGDFAEEIETKLAQAIGGGEVADRLGALVFRASGSITVERDEIGLADDAQAIVSMGGRTFDTRIEPSLILPVRALSRIYWKHGRPL